MPPTLSDQDSTGTPSLTSIRARRPLRLGVIIPAYNESANLRSLLNFLRLYPSASTHAPLELRVWLDVSGSTDGTTEAARSYARGWPALEVVDTGVRDGLLCAVDRLLHLATGDVILRMDADVRVTADTLDRMLTQLTATGGGIVGGRIVPAPSKSWWVRRLSPAEYELHHQVSRVTPKTTVVQMFRSARIRLSPEVGVEDQAIQAQVNELVGPAVYAPDAIVTVVPPANLRDFLYQRSRTIEHLHAHRARGFGSPPTDSWGAVGAATLAALRERTVPALDLALFLGAEGGARLAAFWTRLTGRTRTFAWDPIPDTKQPVWATVGGPVAPTTRAAEDPMPLLTR